MRFGCFVPQGWRLDLVGIDRRQQWPTMVEVAKSIEAAGFESGWVFDHFHTIPVATQEPTYEAWTLMSALAVATDSLRLGQMCTCNGYRSPAHLAKVAASVDVISGGRVEMGIGGGWYEGEYLGYGYEFPKPSVRLGELDEAVQIMRMMWTEDEVHFEGKHYRLQGAISQPKPLQKPHIPIWVAGGGEQLTLRTAARFADYTNFGQTVDEFDHKSKVLANHCKEQGTDFDRIVRSADFTVTIGETQQDVEERLNWLKATLRQGGTPEDRADRFVATTRESLAGTPEQIVEELQRWRAAGMTYTIVLFQEIAHDKSGLEMFTREVMPALA